MNYRTADFVAAARAWTGKRGVDVAIDPVGAATFEPTLRCLTRGGRYVICGATSGHTLDFDVRYLWMRQKRIIGSHFANAWECHRANELIEAGKVRPVLWRTLGFDQVAEAHQLMYTNQHLGKISILVGAEAEGLVVMDDPESIVRCTNKVYQAELFAKHGIPCPKTLIVHKDNRDEVGKALGFPCVLKRPDSSFSAGVEKAENQAELEKHLDAFFDKSELVVAQEFVPSSFDWRIGVLDGAGRFYRISTRPVEVSVEVRAYASHPMSPHAASIEARACSPSSRWPT